MDTLHDNAAVQTVNMHVLLPACLLKFGSHNAYPKLKKEYILEYAYASVKVDTDASNISKLTDYAFSVQSMQQLITAM